MKLLAIWADDRVQAQLEGCHHNKEVYERMVKLLREEGYITTYEQCREKLKKLKAEYRKIKDKKGKTGEGKKDWDFFEPIDAVLGHKPATQPAVVIDTLTDNDVDLDGVESVSESTSTSKIDVVEEPGTSNTPRSKKHKRSKTDAFETALGSVVNKMLEAQNESEQRLLEFEEKRMKMEEAQRIQDRELM